MAKIQRVTLFKVSDPSVVIPQMVEKLKTFQREATKDGKQYIQSYTAGPTVSDARNQGFNFCIQSSFASIEDMKYYDEECQVHAGLKSFMQGKLAGPPLTVFQDEFIGQ
ncbi:hypothetical protein K461DRAFT_275843 [Myriangium duriaei CBS 260.36]|uniref:Stress-response A/B barrel domain-containing protein n=1 Tax=Myriangium duriaei CBS 260.36 TaxID=1168546 RepID=A0A9P4J3B9_9PEZI|nr:hypothetical protein K461DRAFT_275843 [Myriangium duriaei CBS 260.36]